MAEELQPMENVVEMQLEHEEVTTENESSNVTRDPLDSSDNEMQIEHEAALTDENEIDPLSVCSIGIGLGNEGASSNVKSSEPLDHSDDESPSENQNNDDDMQVDRLK